MPIKREIRMIFFFLHYVQNKKYMNNIVSSMSFVFQLVNEQQPP